MSHNDALSTWRASRIAAARSGSDVVLPQSAADGLESLWADLLLLAIPDPPDRRYRPPGQWHCGHWREASGPCCGCGKPAVAAPGDAEPEPCPGGQPWC